MWLFLKSVYSRKFKIVNFPMRQELVFLSPFVYSEYEIDSFCGVKCNLEGKVFKEKIINWRKITLKVNEIMPNMKCSHKTSILDNSSKNKKFKKTVFFIPNSRLDELFNDTTHISLRWIYRSAKIYWTKKNPFEYIVPSPTSGVGTISTPTGMLSSESCPPWKLKLWNWLSK